MANSRVLNISAVVAITPNYGIGMNGTLPWVAEGIRLHQDMEYFKQTTSKTDDILKRNAVVMGRRTWEGIPQKYRPLKGRLNIILSKVENGLNVTNDIKSPHNEVLHATSLASAIHLAEADPSIENIVVIGGASLFEESIKHPQCNSFHVTEIKKEFPSDVFLTPETISILNSMVPEVVSEEFEENSIKYQFKVYNPSSAHTNNFSAR